jgi:hypothetical protein
MDEEIIREVFELNSNADIKKLEELTGLPSLTIGRIKGQVSIRRKRESRASEKSLEEGEMGEVDTRQYIAQYGREGLNKIKRGFLKKTLAIAPAMSDKTAEWILHKWDINPRIQDDPNAFYEMLHNDAGLKPNIAISIAKDVFSLEEQYADILEDQGLKPIFISGSPRFSGQSPSEPFGRQREDYPRGPFEVSGGRGRRRDSEGSEQFLTIEEYRRLEREKEEKSRIQRLDEKVDKISQDLSGAIGNLKEDLLKEVGKKSSEETSVEEIPIDKDGNPTSPELAVSVKRVIRGSGGIIRKDPFDMYLQIRQAEKLDKTGQLDSEGVRKIVQDVVGSKPTGPLPEITEVNRKIEMLAQQLVDRDKEMSEREKQALRDQITDLKGDVRTLSDRVSSGGVNSVEGMLTSVGGKLVDKNPLKEAGQLVKDILTPSANVITAPEKAPAVTQTTPGTSSGILDALRVKGLVTTVRERVVGPRQ